MQLAVAIESTVDGDLSDFIVDLNQDYREVKQSATNNSARRGGQTTKKKKKRREKKKKKKGKEKEKRVHTRPQFNAYLCAIKWWYRVLHIGIGDPPVSVQLRPISPRISRRSIFFILPTGCFSRSARKRETSAYLRDTCNACLRIEKYVHFQPPGPRTAVRSCDLYAD